MHSGKDQVNAAQGLTMQLPAPGRAGATGATAASGPRDQSYVAALLQAIAGEITQSDLRQGSSLADLRARLDTMTVRQATSEAVGVDRAHHTQPPAETDAAAPNPALLALADLRGAAASPARLGAARPTAPLEGGLDSIYASVAQSYAQAAGERGRGSLRSAPAAKRTLQARPAAAEPADEDADNAPDQFLDMSALANPEGIAAPRHPPLAAPRRPAAPQAAYLQRTAGAYPAVAASAAIEKSIGELSSRIAETERKVEGISGRQMPERSVETINAHIDSLRDELEKLTSEHQKISAELGDVSTNVKSLTLAADRIGPLGVSVTELNDAIAALRQDMPGYAVDAAGRVAEQLAGSLGHGDGAAGLADKLAIVQNLLLTQSRVHQESEGRSFGILESIRGLVETLLSRIDALEAVEIDPQPAAHFEPEPQPHHVQGMFEPTSDPMLPHAMLPLATTLHSDEPEADLEPELVSSDTAAAELAAVEPPRASISRDELIASARRAAMALSQADADHPPAAKTGGAFAPLETLRGLQATAMAAISRYFPGLFDRVGSRAILTTAMVGLVAASLGMVAVKVLHKPAPRAVVIEHTALPAMPDDLPDLAGPPKAAAPGAPGKDASKPAPADPAAKPAAQSPALPGKASAMTPDAPASQMANAMDAAPAKKMPISAPPAAAIPPAVPAADDLPTAIAPQSVRSAAQAGDAAAAYTIGQRYLSGKDVARDPLKARRWFEQSATAGYPLAEFQLGLLFEKGDQGLAPDRTTAMGWYRKGADHGNVQAMYNLAVLLTSQTGAAPDYVSAAKWFGQASNFGLKDSQFNLAVLYQSGLGVPKDPAAAYKWFAIAAAGGDPEAGKQRDDMRKQISAGDLAAIGAEVKAWHPQMPDHHANSGDMPGLTVAAPAAATAAAGSPAVTNVQQMLAKLGYEPGPIDGTVSDQTRAAIKAFEQKSNMPADGDITDDLVAKLKGLAG